MQTAARFIPQYTKKDERRALAEIRERRNASPRHDPSWVAKFWLRMSR
jgi:hypothetical protein